MKLKNLTLGFALLGLFSISQAQNQDTTSSQIIVDSALVDPNPVFVKCPPYYIVEPTDSIQTIEINLNQKAKNKSLLCGDELQYVSHFPQSLIDKSLYISDYTVKVDTFQNTIRVDYNLTSTPNKTSDSTLFILNKYLPSLTNFNSGIYPFGDTWYFTERYMIGDSVYTDNRINFQPYEPCISYTTQGDSLLIIRKRISSICPSTTIISKYHAALAQICYFDTPVENSPDFMLNVSIEDSVIYNKFVCMALGYRVVSDTFVVDSKFGYYGNSIFNLTVTELKKTQVWCVTAPCPMVDTYLEYDFGVVNLRQGIKTDIDKDKIGNGINVFPNPALDKLRIKGVNSISLTDLYGNISQFAGDGEFDISSLSSGIYSVSYWLNDQLYVEKLLKK